MQPQAGGGYQGWRLPPELVNHIITLVDCTTPRYKSTIPFTRNTNPTTFAPLRLVSRELDLGRLLPDESSDFGSYVARHLSLCRETDQVAVRKDIRTSPALANALALVFDAGEMELNDADRFNRILSAATRLHRLVLAGSAEGVGDLVSRLQFFLAPGLRTLHVAPRTPSAIPVRLYLRDLHRCESLRRLDINSEAFATGSVVSFGSTMPPALQQLRLSGIKLIAGEELKLDSLIWACLDNAGLEPSGKLDLRGATGLRTLSLAGNPLLGDEGVAGLELKDNSVLEELDLDSVGLEDPRCLFLDTNATLTVLDLSDNRLASSLAHLFLHLNSTLQVLLLNGNPLVKEDLGALGSQLKVNTTLRRLGLDRCELDDDALSEFNLSHNVGLRWLSLVDNGIADAGVGHMRLQQNTGLKTVCLWRNPRVSSLVAHGMSSKTRLVMVKDMYSDSDEEE